jgi:biopolymer transport protein ExbB
VWRLGGNPTRAAARCRHNPAQISLLARLAVLALQTFRSEALFSILQAAGWPIVPLLLCSVVALALIIERFLSLREARVAPGRLVDEVISVTRSSLPPADTVNKLAENSTLGLLLAQGIRAAMAEPRISETNLRLAFEGAGREAVHQLERNLNALGTIASAAPLLGLLGTVIGMIEIFGASSAAGAGGNPLELAHGISVALYNTAFGLIVAIPSLMCYRYFRGRIDSFALRMELAAERMVPHLLRLTHPRR